MIDSIGSKQGLATLPRLTLVLGGARSGKSALAERLAEATEAPRLYVATAEALDAEMRARIDAHRGRRMPGWQTVECPLSLQSALADAPAKAIVLVDCATLWLSNHLLAGHDLQAESMGLLSALRDCPAKVIVVSNEVGMSIVPENRLARQFSDAQGRLNQLLATQAQLVIVVWAGLPLVLKGFAPEAML